MGESAGIGILGILTIIFIVLKAADVITWPWWLVLSPIILGAIFMMLVMIFIILAVALTQ